MSRDQLDEARFIRNCIIGAFAFCLAVIAATMAGCPVYGVYTQTKAGEAELKRAEQNRQIIVQSAQAKTEAAAFEKEAEIIAAEGRAEAMKIMQAPLRELTDAQARVLILYNWVKGLNDESTQTIYVPTESNLPLFLEAGRIADSSGPTAKGLQIEAELSRDVTSEGGESSDQIRE